MYVIIYDVHDSVRFCPLESVAHLQMLKQWALFLLLQKELILNKYAIIQFRLIDWMKRMNDYENDSNEWLKRMRILNDLNKWLQKESNKLL